MLRIEGGGEINVCSISCLAIQRAEEDTGPINKFFACDYRSPNFNIYSFAHNYYLNKSKVFFLHTLLQLINVFINTNFLNTKRDPPLA